MSGYDKLGESETLVNGEELKQEVNDILSEFYRTPVPIFEKAKVFAFKISKTIAPVMYTNDSAGSLHYREISEAILALTLISERDLDFVGLTNLINKQSKISTGFKNLSASISGKLISLLDSKEMWVSLQLV